ncbi:hypothetical protein [Streptomyces sp. NPDC007984]|uniref:hypothetical protein n=1 Tax=Streptomyces sp. NPDC007984 TaxID=3364801 RepID=UPI0036E9F50C
MGYKRKRPTVTLEFTDEDGDFAGLEVEVKSLPMGEFFELSRLVRKKNMTDEEVEKLLRAFARVLVRWNLENEDDTPVPATYEGLMGEDLAFNIKLIGTWLKAIAPPDEGSDLGKDSPSGGNFPGRPLTMEAL